VLARSIFSVLLLGVMLGGCTDRPTFSNDDGTAGASSEGGVSSGSPPATPPSVTTSTSGVTTGAVDSTTGSAEGNSADDSSIFCNLDDDEHWHCPPDAGTPWFECDVWAQDCGEGDKCLPWANDGSSVWNATHCSPIEPMPAAPGEACTVEGSAVSGIDSCQLGSMCWHVDPATLEGECVAMCGDNEATPLCEDPNDSCGIFNQGAVVLCLPACDPVVPLCDAGEVCVPTPDEDRWVCTPSVPLPSVVGERCDYLNACEPGSVCGAAYVVPARFATSICPCAPMRRPSARPGIRAARPLRATKTRGSAPPRRACPTRVG